jgi:general L-amino acid transport system substrate-binding protein
MVTAEELGVTQANVEELAASSQDPEMRRFLGADGTLGQDMGVSNDWMASA